MARSCSQALRLYKATTRNNPLTDQSVDYSSCRLCKKQGLPFLEPGDHSLVHEDVGSVWRPGRRVVPCEGVEAFVGDGFRVRLHQVTGGAVVEAAAGIRREVSGPLLQPPESDAYPRGVPSFNVARSRLCWQAVHRDRGDKRKKHNHPRQN